MERDTLHPTYGTILAVAKISRLYSEATTRLESWTKKSTYPAVKRSSMISIIDEAMQLQADLTSWANSLPQAVGTRYITTADGHLLIVHSSRWLGSVWSMYLSTLILFYSKVMSCCQVILDTDCDESAAKVDQVRAAAALAEKSVVELVGTICGGIPYLLGHVDEDGQPRKSPGQKASILYNMVWPLAVVRRCRFSSESQVRECGESLGYIGALYGLNLAYNAELVIAEAMGGIL